MKSHVLRGIMLLLLIIVAGCATGQQGRTINLGDMLPGEMISLKDGTKINCEIQFISSFQRGGTMTAFDPVSNESFTGQYRVLLNGGGSSTGVVRNSWGFTTGTVQTTSDPKNAVAMGVFTGDKDTIIDVSINLIPTKRNLDDSFLFFSGHGTGTDNHGVRYQIYFGY